MWKVSSCSCFFSPSSFSSSSRVTTAASEGGEKEGEKALEFVMGTIAVDILSYCC